MKLACLGCLSLALIVKRKNFICSLLNNSKVLNHIWFSYSMRSNDFLNLVSIASNSVKNWFNANFEWKYRFHGIHILFFVHFGFSFSLFKLFIQFLQSSFSSIFVQNSRSVLFNFLLDFFNFIVKFFDFLTERLNVFKKGKVVCFRIFKLFNKLFDILDISCFFDLFKCFFIIFNFV